MHIVFMHALEDMQDLEDMHDLLEKLDISDYSILPHIQKKNF